jgi:hypothetical protein
MRAKIFFITLAVADLRRPAGFYRDGLGWPTEGFIGQEFHDQDTGADGTIALFTLDGGLMLILHERANLAKDASLPPGPPQLHRVQRGYPRRIAGSGGRGAPARRSCRRDADRTGPHATVWGLLRVLHRSRSSSVRDCLELQPAETK